MELEEFGVSIDRGLLLTVNSTLPFIAARRQWAFTPSELHCRIGAGGSHRSNSRSRYSSFKGAGAIIALDSETPLVDRLELETSEEKLRLDPMNPRFKKLFSVTAGLTGAIS